MIEYKEFFESFETVFKFDRDLDVLDVNTSMIIIFYIMKIFLETLFCLYTYIINFMGLHQLGKNAIELYNIALL